ncbi:MAG: CPBP family intramembrane metalloprotease [Clostridia bacterium]|nr:CPBP family intramembrane metalloprotease [Clostridia bacterium]
MTVQEKAYRSVISRLGVSMLVLFGLITVYRTVALEYLPQILSFMPQVVGRIVYELALALVYALTFLAPVFIFYGISKNKPHEPFDAKLYLPRGTLLYLFAALGIVAAAAHLNTYIVNIFDAISLIRSEPTASTQSVPRASYEILLAFISTAVVPAFVEEALFRGTVLKNLLPFGRTTAVFVSALLFGMMHQTATQFFYATVAGLVIGYIYVYTKSIWCAVLIHFCNNALSVLLSILYERLPIERAVLVEGIYYLAILALGIIAALVLMRMHRENGDALLLEGAFERDVPPDAEYAETPLPMARRVKVFFTPPMIIFVALCAVQVLYMLLYAVLY